MIACLVMSAQLILHKSYGGPCACKLAGKILHDARICSVRGGEIAYVDQATHTVSVTPETLEDPCVLSPGSDGSSPQCTKLP